MNRYDILANENFSKHVKIGDVVISKKGRYELLGYGVVDSDYFYDSKRSSYQKCRKVSWKLKGNWIVDFNLVLKTLTDITKYSTDDKNYNTYYEQLLGIMKANHIMTPHSINIPRNQILFGPPGTGKSFILENLVPLLNLEVIFKGSSSDFIKGYKGMGKDMIK